MNPLAKIIVFILPVLFSAIFALGMALQIKNVANTKKALVTATDRVEALTDILADTDKIHEANIAAAKNLLTSGELFGIGNTSLESAFTKYAILLFKPDGGVDDILALMKEFEEESKEAYDNGEIDKMPTLYTYKAAADGAYTVMVIERHLFLHGGDYTDEDGVYHYGFPEEIYGDFANAVTIKRYVQNDNEKLVNSYGSDVSSYLEEYNLSDDYSFLWATFSLSSGKKLQADFSPSWIEGTTILSAVIEKS